MAVVASATGVALGMTAGTVGAGLVGGAVLGAGAGALYSGITGDGNILNSALTGAAIGGSVGGLGAAFGPALMGTETLAGAAINPATGLAWEATGSGLAGGATPAMQAAQLTSSNTAALDALAASNGVVPEMSASLPGAGLSAAPANLPSTIAPATVESATSQLANVKPATDGLTPKEMLGYGLAGTAALSLLGGMNQKKLSSTTGTTPSYIRPSTYNVTQNQSAYPTGPQYGSNGLPILPTKEQSYFNQSYTAGTPYQAADGGLMTDSPDPAMMKSGLADVNFMGNDMYPTSQQHRSYYATPNQMPTSAQEVAASYEPKTNPLTGQMTANMAGGGITYDAATQTYQGLPGIAPASEVPQLSADLVSQLTPQWQAQNPRSYSYDAATQKYGAGKPTMAQLNALKAQQDEALAMQSYTPFGSDNSGGGAAHGGLMPYNLGSYSDGGRLLKGPGDGVSDDIPAVIGQKQPARLADGEFVIPARIVSELGNGSTDAGAKRLYAMMDRIQEGRKKTVGKGNVAKDTKAKKHLLA